MLKTILENVAQETGLNATSERAYLLRYINKAADELYYTYDLFNCEREQLFNVGSSNQQITLPSYVYRISALRNYDTTSTIILRDMRPRYSANRWNKPYEGFPYLTWRQKFKSPVQADTTNIGPVVINIAEAATVSFDVLITGTTANASRITETLSFIPGDLTKTTTNNFLSFESLRKSVPCNADITFVDAGGVTIATLGNNELYTEYTIIQILDRYQEVSEDQLVEVLYKTRFYPFINDYDSYPCGDLYDEAIYWKTMELLVAKQVGQEDRAMLCAQKCVSLIRNIHDNIEPFSESNMVFSASGIQRVYRALRYNRGDGYSNRYPLSWNR